jgi:hypothetical protein
LAGGFEHVQQQRGIMLRHTSLIAAPDVCASRKIETICSSLKRFLFIESLDSGRGFYIIRWPNYWGAGQGLAQK